VINCSNNVATLLSQNIVEYEETSASNQHKWRCIKEHGNWPEDGCFHWMEDGLSPTDTKWLPHSTDLPEFINIDPITFHALRLNMAISLLSKASAASPTWTQEYRGYLSMRLQRKLHNNTLKVTVLSVQVKQKQTQWEWVQSEPYECHSQSIRPSPPSWMAVISCHDSPHQPMKLWQLVRISFISF
jgi:hypothetical protein